VSDPPTPRNASPLSPAASEAHRIADVWWLILALAVVVVLVVLGLVVVGLLRRPDDVPADDPHAPDEARDRRFIAIGGLLLPAVVLTIAAVATVTSARALRRPTSGELRVDVTGVQWFWRISYPGTEVATANEIRLPVDRAVLLRLRSEDVIHSLWVPRLAGKVDLIPGQTNELRFTPTKVGTYRGECAEFCGLQHAHMAFVVRVVPRDEFERWVRDHGRPVGPRPAGTEAAAGEQVFANGTCAGCHTVRGLTDGTRGPDLTDLASRRTIGAGTLPNDPVHLRAWIRDPQEAKPGAHMPPTLLSPQEIDQLVAYLGTLR
jgi:cytochrome c oxidase subunit 2